MQKLTNEEHQIHEQAVRISMTYHKAERDLLEILKQVDRTKLFKKLGQSSLFCYLHRALNFSPAVARAAVTVYRKCQRLPELKRALEKKEISMSTASRFVSAVTTENVASLIEFAKTHSHRQIDREVARLNPKSAQADRIRPISEDLFQSNLTFTAEMIKDLERYTELLAQAGKHASPSEVIAHALKIAIYHKDPVQKAARAMARKQKKQNSVQTEKPVIDSARTESARGKSSTKQRVPLTAARRHEVMHRDGGRCTHVGADGRRCDQERYIDIHHIVPVGEGGGNELENLTILCGTHHDLAHQLTFSHFARASRTAAMRN